MSAFGPALPPHLLAKRKRKQEEQAEDESAINAGAKPPKSPDEANKRRRSVGPALPPASRPMVLPDPPMPPKDEDSDDSDDEDDFGPALPSAGDAAKVDANSDDNDHDPQLATEPVVERKLKRDDWMTMPPKQDDLAARVDPSRPRPTAFNIGKGARGSSSIGAGDSSSWHETPEQKQKRLQDEMMGIGKPSAATGPEPARSSFKSGKQDAAHKKIQEHVEKIGGPSLLDQHTQSKGAGAVEDDASKRAFDREKDMGGSGYMSSSQWRQMLNKAAELQGRFSGGSYL